MLQNQFINETYPSIIKDGINYSAKFEDNYFEMGVSRYAFRGILCGIGPQNNTLCVTKVFKDNAANGLTNWSTDVNTSVIANQYAQAFCMEYNQRITGSDVKMEFVIPQLAKMWYILGFNLSRLLTLQSMVAIEPFLAGTYEKFNSNGGFEQQLGQHDIMKTFSHWTWSNSGHTRMVCDLQGVYDPLLRKYTLTDPAIHSVGQVFGTTDLGALGMEAVLKRHQCNSYCLQLGLTKPIVPNPNVPNPNVPNPNVPNPYAPTPSYTYLVPGRKPTTYNFQVDGAEMMGANQRWNWNRVHQLTRVGIVC